MIRIQIPRRSRSCSSCHQTLIPGQVYVSSLKEGQKEGVYDRNDFCDACWNSQETKNHKTFWKGSVPVRKPISENPEEHFLEILDVLREEIEKDQPESDRTAFVLALYLARKKRLALRQEIEEVLLYEVLATEEMIPVKKISLTKEQLTEIQKNLDKRFS